MNLSTKPNKTPGAGCKSRQMMSMKTKLKIKKAWIETKLDESPDLSHLGEYTDTPQPDAIIRIGRHAGKFVSELGEDDELPSKCREFRFFVPAMTGEQTGNPDSPKQDYERMEAYSNGQWNMVGIIAKAEIRNPESMVTQVIRSGGLWGIESDSDASYLEEVGNEQLAELRAELTALGIGSRAIDVAFQNVEKRRN